MLKIFGILLLCGLFGYFAFDYTRHQQKRLYQTEGFLLLLRWLRGQISCYSLPISEAVAGFENKALEECGFLPRLRTDGFPVALGSCRDSLSVTKETERMLSAFAEGVGKSYREEQIALCDFTIGELEAAVHHVRQECPKQARLGRSLLISGGLALILVLL